MAEQIDEMFINAVSQMRSIQMQPSHGVAKHRLSESGLDEAQCQQIFDAQMGSRHVDLAARWLRSQGKGFYTIGSAGHEGNAAVAAAVRPTDPALLHYRSGAFYLQRAHQAGIASGVRDILLGVVAAREDPASGGRHKVFGSKALAVIPQTSTIASHLPRAVGLAVSMARARRIGVDSPWPADAMVICSFGDASANHSTATGAINAAIHTEYQSVRVPVLFVCEDNGIGISVPTPNGWIAHAFGSRPGLKYFHADGCDFAESFAVAHEAATWVRQHGRPAFLHLDVVRLMGHAGSDLETAYRRGALIRTEQDKDPLVSTARLLISGGVLSCDDVRARYEAKRRDVLAVAEEVARLPQLTAYDQIAAPLRWPNSATVAHLATISAPTPGRRQYFGDRLPEQEGPMTLAQAINRSLADMLIQYPEAVVFGEDVAAKGGVYGVTRGLARKFGRARVFDTLLDEQAILGLGLGAGLSGLLPIPEIQYLAYVHNAEDQLRGEAASLRFFSDVQFVNPMVTRMAAYGYQKGFGGHFHNDNSVAVLRDIPGLVIASPASPDDAAAMLRACLAAAKHQGTVSVFLEPIALYHTRDLHEPNDGLWLAPYAAPETWSEADAPLGRGRTHGSGDHLTMVTFANGLYMSQRVARRLSRRGIRARILDLRWLAPLPVEDIAREAAATGRVLVVDETRQSGGVSEAIVTALMESGFAGALARVTSADSYIPLGTAAASVLLSEDAIEAAALNLLKRPASSRLWHLRAATTR